MGSGAKRRDVVRRLERGGWQLIRKSGGYDIYGCPCGAHIVPVPRHRELSPGVVENIYKAIEKG